jgi:hypothetical protein
MEIRLIDADGDRFAGPFTPGADLPAALVGVSIGKDGMPDTLIVRYVHEMTLEERMTRVNMKGRSR